MTPNEEKITSTISNAWLIGLLLAAAIFALSINTIGGNFGDTGYHIRTGEYILQTQSVPHEDIFSYTYPKNPWVAHYWLSDIIFFLVYKFAGLLGIIFFPAILASMTYLMIWRASVLRGADPTISAVITLAASYLTLEQWVSRPQIFLYLFSAALILIFEHWRKNGSSKWIYAVPFMILTWTNMHASAIFGAGIFGIYLLPEVIKNGIAKNLKLIVIFLISCGVMFLNPNGYKVVFFSFLITDAVKQMMILEWRSLLYSISKVQAKIFLLEMAIMSGFVAYRFAARNLRHAKTSLADLALILVAFALPLISIRHVGLFPLLALVPFAYELTAWLKEKGFELEKKSLLRPIVISFFVVTITSALVGDLSKEIIYKGPLPVGATQFVKENGIPGPIFNSVDNGGYLIWALWPGEKVFIDGRNEVYAGPVFEEYLSIFRQTAGWEEIFDDKYKVNLVILPYRDINRGYVYSLFKTLTESGKFKFVFWDDGAIVLARNTTENKTVIDKYAYELISPFTDPFDIPQERRPQVASELRRALEISPDSEILRAYIGQ